MLLVDNLWLLVRNPTHFLIYIFFICKKRKVIQSLMILAGTECVDRVLSLTHFLCLKNSDYLLFDSRFLICAPRGGVPDVAPLYFLTPTSNY